jgi:hypothetical protein
MLDLSTLVPTILTIAVTVAISAFTVYNATAIRNSEQDAMTRAELAAIRVSVDALKAAVEKLNLFAERLPVVEAQITDIKRDLDDIFNRLRKLEIGGKQ